MRVAAAVLGGGHLGRRDDVEVRAVVGVGGAHVEVRADERAAEPFSAVALAVSGLTPPTAITSSSVAGQLWWKSNSLPDAATSTTPLRCA